MLELRGVKETHVDIFEARPIQRIAAYVAVRATGADAAGHAGPVVSERCTCDSGCNVIEPRSRYAVGGANSAAVRAEYGAGAAGNVIRALSIRAVKALIGSCGH